MRTFLMTAAIVLTAGAACAGNGFTMRTDNFGRTTFSDNNGYSGTARTDSFGRTTIHDNRGNTTFCRTDNFGRTSCN